MRRTLGLIAAASVGALGAAQVPAQSPEQDSMASQTPGGRNGLFIRDIALDEYMNSIKSMDGATMAAKGPTPDATYARKMIAYRQGAIALARIELKHGLDVEVRRLAHRTIDENTREIAQLEAFLRQHGG